MQPSAVFFPCGLIHDIGYSEDIPGLHERLMFGRTEECSCTLLMTGLPVQKSNECWREQLNEEVFDCK